MHPALSVVERAAPGPDVVGIGIVIATLILFVGTGSTVLTRIVRGYLYGEANGDLLLGNALILNIALLILGWRRYADLSHEVLTRRIAEAEARKLAHTDALTGCLNRRSIDGAIEALAHHAAMTGKELVVAVIDLDRFKRSNDAHGHQVGDALLVETARRLAGLLPKGSLLGRMGGDEFVTATILAPASAAAGGADTNGSDPDELGKAIAEGLGQPIDTHGIRVPVSASIGLARAIPENGKSVARLVQDLLHRADLAMYQAKRNGRDRFCWFDPTMENELQYRANLEQALRDGIALGEFVPFYERQVDIESGDLIGFEMLARWQSPVHGLVMPDVFIPIAEDLGLIAELSERLIRQALADARSWPDHLVLAVNISPRQLRDPWFSQRLLKLLLEAGFPPSRLDVEITESCLHENIGVVRTLITSLRNQGVKISLDDFGTGYSSIAQLRSLPFDRIKIDRSFVTSMGDNRDSDTIVSAIASLGQGLGLPITAEGVETEPVRAMLCRMGLLRGQGYLYGTPVCAADVGRDLVAMGFSPPVAAPLHAASSNGVIADESASNDHAEGSIRTRAALG
nr:EAL domain-containing protein [Novosphingobium sp. FKTRR1]